MFSNRSEAGRLLGRRLQAMGLSDPVVLALPRGGVPVGVAALSPQVDDLVCLSQPIAFRAVGEHYADFGQVSDDEVVRLMRMAASYER